MKSRKSQIMGLVLLILLFFIILPGCDGGDSWVKTWGGNKNTDDQANGVAMDDQGNAYVTGCTYTQSSGLGHTNNITVTVICCGGGSGQEVFMMRLGA